MRILHPHGPTTNMHRIVAFRTVKGQARQQPMLLLVADIILATTALATTSNPASSMLQEAFHSGAFHANAQAANTSQEHEPFKCTV